MLKRILWLQLAWFLCFVAGGVLIMKTAWDNAHMPAACSSGVASRPFGDRELPRTTPMSGPCSWSSSG